MLEDDFHHHLYEKAGQSPDEHVQRRGWLPMRIWKDEHETFQQETQKERMVHDARNKVAKMARGCCVYVRR